MFLRVVINLGSLGCCVPYRRDLAICGFFGICGIRLFILLFSLSPSICTRVVIALLCKM